MKPSKLLNSPEKWNQDYFALDKDGREVEPRNLKAVTWCVLGAIRKCSKNDRNLRRRMERKLNKYITTKSSKYFDDITCWNDDRTTTYKKVINVLKKLDL